MTKPRCDAAGVSGALVNVARRIAQRAARFKGFGAVLLRSWRFLSAVRRRSPTEGDRHVSLVRQMIAFDDVEIPPAPRAQWAGGAGVPEFVSPSGPPAPSRLGFIVAFSFQICYGYSDDEKRKNQGEQGALGGMIEPGCAWALGRFRRWSPARKSAHRARRRCRKSPVVSDSRVVTAGVDIMKSGRRVLGPTHRSDGMARRLEMEC